MASIEDLTLEEYKFIRLGIAETVSELRTTEKGAILASAAIWAWLIKDGASVKELRIVYFIPFFICLLGAIRSAALFVDLNRHVKFQRILEKDPRTQSALGWETFMAERKGRWLGLTSIVVWAVLLIGNIWLAFYGGEIASMISSESLP